MTVSQLLSFIFLLFTVSLTISQPKTNYSENLAKQMIKLAGAAYSDNINASISCSTAAYPDASYEFVTRFAEICDKFKTVCSGYIVKSTTNKDLIIVFRGTRTNDQLLAEGWNSLSGGIDFLGMGKVNKYFSRALDVLWQSVWYVASRNDYRDYSVKVTGHSLGGALASLCAAKLVKEGIVPPGNLVLYTFGQPRVGNGEFAVNHDALGIQSYRVVYRQDIVPHLPYCNKDSTAPDGSAIAQGQSRPCQFLNTTKAYHHGTEIWYPESMLPGSEYVECTGEPKNEDFNCSDQLVFQPSNVADYIFDHRNYFGVLVTSYGKAGCPLDYPQSTDAPNRDQHSSLLGKLADKVANAFQKG